jgi:MYXO-CTERM domain-containing protein
MTTRHLPRSAVPFAAGLFLAGALALPRVASAATYYYVDWTAADVSAGTASGTITLPDSSVVTVTFAAANADSSPGNLYGAQINGAGTNYWTPTTPYISAEVENAPPTPDIIQLSGGQNETYTVTLSAPIVDPIMSIVSLGAPSTTITYDFDSPFTIVSQAAGYFGGSTTALAELANNVLQGTEGSGTIQFLGTFSTFSWTVPTPETWHGFTFGIRTTLALDPEAGAPDAGTDSAVVDAALDSAALDSAAPDSSVVDSGADGDVADAGGPDAAVEDAGGPDGEVADTGGLGGADASGLGGADASGLGGADASGLGGADAGAMDGAVADATVPDAAATGDDGASPADDDAGDAGDDAGGPSSGSATTDSGCSCTTVGTRSDLAFLPIGSLVVLGAFAGRRRTRRKR